MLILKDIRKSYQTFDFSQTALDGVSVIFRDNEFAAILGPSGSGKTTLLNIIGGLDHYDSGDLEIDGISTKKYKASDWDTYRNNRIGFVFQSYNLISHQSVLANVELALTLSGVSKDERKERAYKALEEVGLKEHARKLPNQLSGGQMQRVALARALINDPEILLADEPTGALDTKTSEQVMGLLKNIAKDRLVIMVTHNPDLADEYANRIIQLQDGHLIADTNPFDPNAETQRQGRSPRKVAMSFFTAVSLSLSNLMTKKGRTFVTSLAGSIGIIGIAAILALANGINAYITNIEQETMSIYPLSVQSSSIDLSSLFAGMRGSDSNGDESSANASDEEVPVRKIVESLFKSQSENDLKSLASYILENGDDINPYVKNIQYIYDVTPQIYLADTSKNIDQVNPDALMQSYGMGSNMGMGSFLGTSSGPMNMFFEMPGDISMFDYQYDIKAGRWPERYDEAVLVLMPDGGISDFLLYSMGIQDRNQLKNILDAFMNNPDEEVEIKDSDMTTTYSELLASELKVICAADRYEYDDTFDVWLDRSGHEDFMKKVVDNGLDLKLVGIVQAAPDVTASSLSPGINYTPDMIQYLMDESLEKTIVQDQLANPAVNVITGKTFAEEKEENAQAGFNFADLISIDEKALQNAFSIDESKMDFDMSGFSMDGLSGFDMSGFDMSGFDMSGFGMDGLSGFDLSDVNLDGLTGFDMSGLNTGDLGDMALPEIDLKDLTKTLSEQLRISPDAVSKILQDVLADASAKIAKKEPMDPETFVKELSAIIKSKDIQDKIRKDLENLFDPSQFESKMQKALQSFIDGIVQSIVDQVEKQFSQMQQQMQNQIQKQIQTQIQKLVQNIMGELLKQIQSQIQKQMTDTMGNVPAQIQGQIQTQMEDTMGDIPTQIQDQIQTQMEDAMEDLPSQIQNAITVDQEAIGSAFKIEMSENEIMELMNALMNQSESTFEGNLTLLGYADPESPSQIDFYSIDFKTKEQVEVFLEQYNQQMEDQGDDDKVISYTDLIGTLMSSVTDIVDTISYALIAFVAISLVVSSIMIGVITYVSVLERKKEIGILRAIGASKRDVRRVFNAETLIIGFVAGMMGIIATQIISVVANIIVYNRLNIENIAQLSLNNALILVGISMILAFLSGLFPSSAAARKDPVEALRSE